MSLLWGNKLMGQMHIVHLTLPTYGAGLGHC